MSRLMRLAYGYVVTAIVCIGLLAVSGVRSAQAQAVSEKSKIAFSSTSGMYAILTVIGDAGLFRKYGTDVTMVQAGGVASTQSLVSREVDMSLVGGNDPIGAKLQGAQVVIVSSLVDVIPYSLFVQNTISTPEELKGKTIAIDRVGDFSEFGALVALRALKVDSKAVRFIQVGGMGERFAAMLSGQVEGVLLFPPLTLMAREKGYKELINLGTSGIPSVSACFAVHEGTLKEKPSLITGLTKSISEGVWYYKNHPVETKKSIGSFLRTADLKIVNETWNYYSGIYKDVPRPSLEAVKSTLEFLALRIPKAKEANSEDFVDFSVIDNLAKSGFYQNLLKSK